MKSLIIAIVGKSGSGKTTMTKIIHDVLNVPYLVSYTTRSKRPEEINGVDHWFVTDADVPEKETMLAYTMYGGYHYWVSKDQIKPNATYTYVINEDALVDMIDKFESVYDFVTIYVDRPNINVSIDRTKRDNDRLELDNSFYDYIIINDYDYADFTAKCINCVSEIIKNRI